MGPITIGCYPTLAPTILPPLLHDFGDAHPRVDLQIFEATHDALEGRMASGDVDVAFVYDTLIPGNPRRERLFALPAHVLLAAGDPLADAPAVRLEDLVERDLILLDAPPSSQHTLSLFAARGLTPRIRHRTTSYEAVRTLVGRGLGYGVLVQRPANPASYEGYPVVMKEIEPPVEPVGIEVIWPAATPPTPRTRALIDFARSIRWPGPGRVSALVWGVKASLLDYVRGMPDGAVAVDGAIESADGFTFPSAAGPDDGILRFGGSVTLTGHSGMMRVVIADPWVAVDARELSIADPDDPTGRLHVRPLRRAGCRRRRSAARPGHDPHSRRLRPVLRPVPRGDRPRRPGRHRVTR